MLKTLTTSEFVFNDWSSGANAGGKNEIHHNLTILAIYKISCVDKTVIENNLPLFLNI